MSEALLAPSLLPLVSTFAGCFTAPSFVTFQHILAGWILCLERHTVTGILRAAGAIGKKHHTSFHRFFRQASWDLDSLGLCLIKLALKLLPQDEPIVVPLDDTLGRHTGKHIQAASMHHDPLLSTRTRPVFHWGHLWVVLSIAVRVPIWKKTFALPVLARLYRAQKLCKKERRRFRKKTELAAEMIGVLAAAVPERRFLVVGDANYANSSIVKKLPANIDFAGRAHPDAGLYAPPRPQRMGRPRVKGKRVPSPRQRARCADDWLPLKVEVYGRPVRVRVKVFDALWYRVSGGRLMRFVLIRGWPGHKEDDVLCSTDLSATPAQIIQAYCLRWSLEVTFHEAKGRLGFEEPQNRTERAVERTAPMSLWVYTLTVTWFITTATALKTARLLPQLPWYVKKVPAFSDMLAALRRETWRRRLLESSPAAVVNQKSLAPLLQALAYAG
jgi:DDE superfamily endonuclease